MLTRILLLGLLLVVPSFAQAQLLCPYIPLHGIYCKQVHTFKNGIALQSTTIAKLPQCNAAALGQQQVVNNGQTSPSYLGTVNTTGSTTARVVCNGSNWQYE